MSTTTRRRWGVPVSQHMQRFGRRGENGPKNNAAAAAACCCLVWFPPGPREREREGEGPPPSFSTPPTTEFVSENQLSIRPTVVFLPDLPPHRFSSHPSPLVVARPRSGAAQGRSASSHGVGREFTGAVGGRGLLVWGWGGGSAECWWWGRTLTKPMSEDFSRKH